MSGGDLFYIFMSQIERGKIMKKLLDSVVCRLTTELGYYDDSLTEAFLAAMDNGVSVVDFVDGVLDAAMVH